LEKKKKQCEINIFSKDNGFKKEEENELKQV
jgi:hypothetical protein